MVSNSHGKTIGNGLIFVVSLLFVCGCPSPASLFNPAFLQTLGAGERVATLPGEAPAVVIEVENRTDRVLEFRATWRDVDSYIHEHTQVLGAGEKYSEALLCPIEEMTLGDVSDLDAAGAIIRIGDSSGEDDFVGFGPYIEVESFGVLLQEGINYDCGDSVTFAVLPSSATLSGYQVFAFIRRSGTQAQTEIP